MSPYPVKEFLLVLSAQAALTIPAVFKCFQSFDKPLENVTATALVESTDAYTATLIKTTKVPITKTLTTKITNTITRTVTETITKPKLLYTTVTEKVSRPTATEWAFVRAASHAKEQALHSMGRARYSMGETFHSIPKIEINLMKIIAMLFLVIFAVLFALWIAYRIGKPEILRSEIDRQLSEKFGEFVEARTGLLDEAEEDSEEEESPNAEVQPQVESTNTHANEIEQQDEAKAKIENASATIKEMREEVEGLRPIADALIEEKKKNRDLKAKLEKLEEADVTLREHSVETEQDLADKYKKLKQINKELEEKNKEVDEKDKEIAELKKKIDDSTRNASDGRQASGEEKTNKEAAQVN